MTAGVHERVVRAADVLLPVVVHGVVRDVVVAGEEEERNFHAFGVSVELVPLRGDGVHVLRVALDQVADHDGEVGSQSADLVHRAVEYGPVAEAASRFVADDGEGELLGVLRERPVDAGDVVRQVGGASAVAPDVSE